MIINIISAYIIGINLLISCIFWKKATHNIIMETINFSEEIFYILIYCIHFDIQNKLDSLES